MLTASRVLAVAAVLLASVSLAAPAPVPDTVPASAPATAPATQPADPFAQIVADLRARGEPATPEDLRPPAVKPEDNAALLYEKAAAAIGSNEAGPRSSAESFSENLPYPPTWHRLAAENVRRNHDAFDLVRQATTRPAVAWAFAPDAPLIDQMMKGLGAQRHVANAVADAALYAHFTGDDRDAVILLRGELRHADAVGQKPFLVSKLVMLGIAAITANNAQLLATELTIEGAKHPVRPGIQSPAPRAAVQEVITELLNDARILSPCRQMFREERVFALDQFRQNGFAASPQAAKTLQAMTTLYDACMAASDKPSWQVPNIAIPDDPFCKVLAPSFAKARDATTKLLLTRRMAAISLAVALYRNDQGQFPPDLAALVPQYLPVAPVDPYSRTAQPFQYVILDGTRPMIGSVGPDGRDDSLPQVGLPPDACHSFHAANPGDPDDLWMDLSAWPGK